MSLQFMSSRGGQTGLIPVLSAVQLSLLVADESQSGKPSFERWISESALPDGRALIKRLLLE